MPGGKKKQKLVFDLEKLFKEIYPPKLYTIREPFRPALKASPRDQFVIIGSRTSGKTHTMAAIANAFAIAFPGIRIAYSLPSERQIRKIVKENFMEFIKQSPQIAAEFPTEKSRQSVFSKQFKNGSLINFFYQQVTKEDPAELVRGTHPDILMFDEVQDLLPEYIGALTPTTLNSEIDISYYAGTFKTEYHMSYDLWVDGTQHEWIVTCPKCKAELRADLSVIDLENLELGPFCPRCGYPLKRKDIKENGRLVAMNPNADYVSIRISALFNYWTSWKKIYNIITQSKMPHYLIINEIVALPTEVTSRGITKEDIKKACADYPLYDSPNEEIFRKYILFAGVDWAGENTDTVVTIVGYRAGKIYVLAVERFEGLKVPATEMADRVLKVLRVWNPALVYLDWGMGLERNEKVAAEFNAYVVEFVGQDTPIKFSQTLQRARGNKHTSLSKLFHAIKTREIIFPRYSDIKHLVPEYTIYVLAEYKRGNYLIYEKESDYAKDDALMSLLYAYYAAKNAIADGIVTIAPNTQIDTGINPWDYISHTPKTFKASNEDLFDEF